MFVYVFPVITSLRDYLSVCLYVFTWQKIDLAGGPETFLQLCLALEKVRWDKIRWSGAVDSGRGGNIFLGVRRGYQIWSTYFPKHTTRLKVNQCA